MKNTDDLPRYCLITPEYDGDKEKFLTSLEGSLKSGIQFVQYRSKQLSLEQYADLAVELIALCHQYHAKFLLNGLQTQPLLSKLGVDGLHLPSSDCHQLLTRPINADFILSVACHNRAELQRANSLVADVVLLSPIFVTPCCPNKVPLGWLQFSNLAEEANAPVYALGGLGRGDDQTANSYGAYGIAATRGLWNLVID